MFRTFLALNNSTEIIQLKILIADQGFGYGNHLRPFLCKYLQVRIQGEVYLSSNQKIKSDQIHTTKKQTKNTRSNFIFLKRERKISGYFNTRWQQEN